MLSFEFSLPDDFDDYAWEVQAKGFFSEALLSISGRHYRLMFYDAARLAQEIEGEVQQNCLFFEPNLVVVASVTRSEMERAAESLVKSNRSVYLIAE